jgi:hypothetical protein
MSISAMINNRVAAQLSQTPPPAALAPRGEPVGGAPPAPVGVKSTVVDQLTNYIPTETITLYVAYIAALGTLTAPAGKVLSDASFTSRWVGVGVFALVSALLALGLQYGTSRRNGIPFKWPLFEMISAPVAFIAWALALPDTPLSSFQGYHVEIGAFIVLATTVAVASVAWVFGKTVNYEKVVSA